MERSTLAIYAVLCCLSFYPLRALAQNDTTSTPVYKLELKDGSILIGRIVSEDESKLNLLTLSEMDVLIRKDQIIKRELYNTELIEGLWVKPDPNRTRLLFAPTGRSLRTDNGYFSIYEVFFPFVAVGVSDFLTIAGGMSLIPGADSQLLYIAPKITPYQNDDLDISTGILYIKIPDVSDGAGIVYGVGTYGGEATSFTFGLGFGFAGGDFADNPVIVIGGEFRVSNYTKIITENWLISGEDTNLLSFGVRFFGDNLAGDFGLIYATGTESDGFPFLPWLGFAYNF